ncbi:MAG: hypothetical protein QF408_09580, partial [Pirellulales bacterium]|nr:hypothetical protein [Pirellulales bacterium]
HRGGEPRIDLLPISPIHLDLAVSESLVIPAAGITCTAGKGIRARGPTGGMAVFAGTFGPTETTCKFTAPCKGEAMFFR